MARVNVEGKALTDHRIKLLARRTGMDLFGALGRLVFVWHAATETGSHVLAPDDIDAAAEFDGFAAAMVGAGLAEKVDIEGEIGERLYVTGTRGRIEWLGTCEARNRNGGKARATGAKRAGGRFVAADTNGTSLTSLPPAYAGTSLPAHASAPTLPLPLPPAPTQEQKQKQKSMSGEAPDALTLFPQDPPPESKAKAARREEGAFLEWFNRHFGRAFSGSETVQCQVKSLLARGYTQDDMRDVAWLLKGKWEGEPKMAPHLVPQTILRVTSFGARLDEARQAYRRRSDG